MPLRTQKLIGQSIILFLIPISLGLVLFLMPMAAFAQTQDPQPGIGALELQLYSTQYASETADQRLERIESQVFGETRRGDASTRLKALEKVLKPYVEEQPTPEAGNVGNTSGPASNAMPPPEDNTVPDATDYPTVISLERVVFGRDFARDPLSRRLDRLEKKVFGQHYPQISLADRVDKLLMRYPQASLNDITPRTSTDITEATTKSEDPYTQSSYFSTIGADVYTKLNALETTILGPEQAARQSGQLLTTRLDTLERRVFGYSQAGSLTARLDKLIQASSNPTYPGQTNNGNPYAPNATSSYQSNSSSYGTGGFQSNRTSQNVQIGMGVTSQSQSQYSPELLNMLPNDLRQGLNQGTSRMVQGNGTVIMTETITNPGGVYRLPNGVQVVAPPTSYEQRYQMTPMIITPNTTQAPQQQQGMQVFQPQTNAPASPEHLQQLNDLESKVFGQVNGTDQLELRLWKLENHLSGGKTYSGYAPDARIENLVKLYQYQYLGKLLSPQQTPPNP